jgi:hypothetical protein
MMGIRLTAYEKGGLAYELGKTLDENPYEPGTKSHQEWESGYRAMALTYGEKL